MLSRTAFQKLFSAASLAITVVILVFNSSQSSAQSTDDLCILAERITVGRAQDKNYSGISGSVEPQTTKAYVFQLEANQTAQVDLISRTSGYEFDPELTIVDVKSNTVLGSDDDSGEENNASLDVTASESADFCVIAGDWAERGGSFTLKAQLAPQKSAIAIEFDETLFGEVDLGEARNYTFSGRAGQRVEINVTAATFDAQLELIAQSDATEAATRSEEMLITSTGFPSLRWVLPKTGKYLFSVIRMSEPGRLRMDQDGTYSVRLSELIPPTASHEPTPLTLGQPVIASFSASSLYVADSNGRPRPYRDFTISGDAGKTISLIVQSVDFIPNVFVGAFTPIGFASVRDRIDRDIDRVEGRLQNRTALKFEETGEIVVRVRAPQIGNINSDYTIIAEADRDQ